MKLISGSSLGFFEKNEINQKYVETAAGKFKTRQNTISEAKAHIETEKYLTISISSVHMDFSDTILLKSILPYNDIMLKFSKQLLRVIS